MIPADTLEWLCTKSRAEWERVIDQHVFSERDRRIMKRRLLDDICFESLAEEFEMSTAQVKRIYAKWLWRLTRVANN